MLLRDVARVELGAEDYSTVARYNGKPAAGIAIKLATGANALDTMGDNAAVSGILDALGFRAAGAAGDGQAYTYSFEGAQIFFTKQQNKCLHKPIHMV